METKTHAGTNKHLLYIHTQIPCLMLFPIPFRLIQYTPADWTRPPVDQWQCPWNQNTRSAFPIFLSLGCVYVYTICSLFSHVYMYAYTCHLYSMWQSTCVCQQRINFSHSLTSSSLLCLFACHTLEGHMTLLYKYICIIKMTIYLNWPYHADFKCLGNVLIQSAATLLKAYSRKYKTE